MTEDTKALEDGPALEPTNLLRGLAAVEDVDAAAGVGAMSEDGEDVSNRGKFYAPVIIASSKDMCGYLLGT